jgi:hypothetical protein
VQVNLLRIYQNVMAILASSSRFHSCKRGILFQYSMIILITFWLSLTPQPAGAQSTFQDSPASDSAPIPLMAYYYIWYDTESWNRAKTDYPVLGRYSSDDIEVMQQHVRWAKDVGIDGFIVSWKSTFKLDHRLEQLMEVAAAEDFYLWIIYQGLDFQRDPLPVERVADDLAFFIDRYAEHPAFSLYDRPVVILSGTWEFTPDEIATIADPWTHRDRIYLLASERNVKGYQRLMGLVDGNAYYWSSVNPLTFPGYEEKLRGLSDLVHENDGIWIAPAAPGYDARLLGGSTVVERKDGVTFRQELDAALKSVPDAIGLISWNEFSENSHIEPSQSYGSRYLEVLADIENGTVPQIPDFDSSAPGTTSRSEFYTIYLLIAMSLFVLGSIGVIARRQNLPEQNSGDNG